MYASLNTMGSTGSLSPELNPQTPDWTGEPPTSLARGRPDEEAPAIDRRPLQGRRTPRARYRRGAGQAGRSADQEAADLAWPDCRKPVLRRLHQNADLLRGRGKAAIGGRHQLHGQGLERYQGRESEGHRADPRGDGRRRGRRAALGLGRTPPARHLRLDQRERRERGRRDPRASNPGPARRVHDAPPSRQSRRSPNHNRWRRPAQPGGEVQRPPAHHAGRRCDFGGATHAASGRSRRMAGRNVVRPRFRAAEVRRGHDAAGPAGADDGRVFPQCTGVLPPIWPRPAPARRTAAACDRHASRSDEPRDGDRSRRCRLRPCGHCGAGRERREHPDGRALPAPRRERARRLVVEGWPLCIPTTRRRDSTRSGGGGSMTVGGEWLIRGARQLGRDPSDLLLRNGVIAEAGPAGSVSVPAGAQVYDADGLVALPGLVDLHTHLREPGREDAETVESGTLAAALGGYTAVFAMPNTEPAADTAGVVEQVWRLGREAGHCDVQPIGAVTAGRRGEAHAELGAMAESAAAVRVFSDDGNCVDDAVLMRRALEYVKAFDGVVAQHAQEPRLTEDAQMNEGELSGVLGLRGWPAVAEEAIIAQDALLAGHVGSRLHVCHVSTAGSVEIVRWAKQKGWDITAEVTPHHLLLTDELAATYDPIYKVNPPLRTAADVEALRGALADGTIDVVATDHAPHPVEDKECEWAAAAFGMLGLETALSLAQHTMVDTGRLDWAGVADRMSTRPARIGRIEGQGRQLATGETANLVLYDPSVTRAVDPTESASLSRNTPYVGRELPGRVVATFLRGRPTVLDGKLA